MECVQFYLGAANYKGLTLAKTRSYSEVEYETKHDFIQWLFPSDEPSFVNPVAPVVDEQVQQAFMNDTRLRLRLIISYARFINFLGLELGEHRTPILINADKFQLRVLSPNHNLLRITRVLRSLYLLGLEEYATQFYEFLKGFRDQISPLTFSYWSHALTPEGFLKMM